MSGEEGSRGRIPRGAEQAIELQRLQLMRASSVLTCLWLASLYQEWHEIEIDAADIALLVRRVINDAVDALDIVNLARAVESPDDGLERDNAVDLDDLESDEDEDDDDDEGEDEDEGGEEPDDD